MPQPLARGVEAAIAVYRAKEPHPGDVWRLYSALDTFTRDQLADGIRIWLYPDEAFAEEVIATVDKIAAMRDVAAVPAGGDQ